MRFKFYAVILLGPVVVGGAWAADHGGTGPAKPLFVSPVEASAPAGPAFSVALLAQVQAWISRKVPECPAGVAAAAADKFLGELAVSHPQELDRLTSSNFPARDFESALLRAVSAQLTGESRAQLRADVAQRRVAALLATEGPEAAAGAPNAAALVGKIRDLSDTQYRRLLEGRMDDDDLEIVLRKVRQPAGAAVRAEIVKPKEWTAADIVAEFGRHNQEGSALSRLQAYTIEAELTTTTGQKQRLLLFKMRPDRFRLVVLQTGRTQFILGAEGDRFWQQGPGAAPALSSATAMGARRYMAEFIDPLFTGEGYSFTRLADGLVVGKKTYRLAVLRSDGSKYVANIDAENFREIARESEDKAVTRYADFRVVAGVTMAFREEITDAAGRRGVLELTRITPNPGLIQAFFEPSQPHALDYFEVERLLTPALTAGREQP